jgi:hypothetical protein
MYVGRTPTNSILTGADIADGSISTAKLADTAVSTVKIADDAVTSAKTAFNDIPFKNLIINGDMSISQRTTSESSVNSVRYSACDRWYTNPQNIGTYTISQSTEVPTGQGFGKSYKVDCTTADASPSASDIFQIQQRIEGQNLQLIKKGTSNAESLTLSFWVKSNLTATFGITLQDNDNSRIIGNTFAISSANTWEKKTITFAGDTTGALDNDNANSLQLQFCLGTGSTYTGTDNTSWGAYANAKLGNGVTGNIASSTSNEFYLTGVQLEVGTSASDFEFIPFDVNLQRCQRYYRRFKSTGQTEDDFATIYGNAANGEHIMVGVPLSPTMRSVPSVSIDNPLTIDDHFRSGRTQSSANCVINGNGKGTYIVLKCGNFNSMSTGNTIQFSHNTTTVTIQFSSEL